ncbi:MAG: hypothetical protein JO249_00345 [Acidobacteria bacterium]|nr:hypothetical protein [Acidobacteriota bacterium]
MEKDKLHIHIRELKWNKQPVPLNPWYSRMLLVPGTEIQVGNNDRDVRFVRTLPFEPEAHHQKKVAQAYRTLRTRVLLREADKSQNKTWIKALEEELTKSQ